MSSEEQSYLSRNDIIDNREFTFGSVWKVSDHDVAIPQMDKSGQRLMHEERWVVVISNNSENYHPLCPIITIAPLSHRTDLKRPFDLELLKSNDNVRVDCLLQLKLSQPILKVDLFDEQGEISDFKKIELQTMLDGYYGLAFEEDE